MFWDLGDPKCITGIIVGGIRITKFRKKYIFLETKQKILQPKTIFWCTFKVVCTLMHFGLKLRLTHKKDPYCIVWHWRSVIKSKILFRKKKRQPRLSKSMIRLGHVLARYMLPWEPKKLSSEVGPPHFMEYKALTILI